MWHNVVCIVLVLLSNAMYFLFVRKTQIEYWRWLFVTLFVGAVVFLLPTAFKMFDRASHLILALFAAIVLIIGIEEALHILFSRIFRQTKEKTENFGTALRTRNNNGEKQLAGNISMEPQAWDTENEYTPVEYLSELRKTVLEAAAPKNKAAERLAEPLCAIENNERSIIEVHESSVNEKSIEEAVEVLTAEESYDSLNEPLAPEDIANKEELLESEIVKEFERVLVWNESEEDQPAIEWEDFIEKEYQAIEEPAPSDAGAIESMEPTEEDAEAVSVEAEAIENEEQPMAEIKESTEEVPTEEAAEEVVVTEMLQLTEEDTEDVFAEAEAIESEEQPMAERKESTEEVPTEEAAEEVVVTEVLQPTEEDTEEVFAAAEAIVGEEETKAAEIIEEQQTEEAESEEKTRAAEVTEVAERTEEIAEEATQVAVAAIEITLPSIAALYIEDASSMVEDIKREEPDIEEASAVMQEEENAAEPIDEEAPAQAPKAAETALVREIIPAMSESLSRAFDLKYSGSFAEAAQAFEAAKSDIVDDGLKFRIDIEIISSYILADESGKAADKLFETLSAEYELDEESRRQVEMILINLQNKG